MQRRHREALIFAGPAGSEENHERIRPACLPHQGMRGLYESNGNRCFWNRALRRLFDRNHQEPGCRPALPIERLDSISGQEPPHRFSRPNRKNYEKTNSSSDIPLFPCRFRLRSLSHWNLGRKRRRDSSQAVCRKKSGLPGSGPRRSRRRTRRHRTG